MLSCVWSEIVPFFFEGLYRAMSKCPDPDLENDYLETAATFEPHRDSTLEYWREDWWTHDFANCEEFFQHFPPNPNPTNKMAMVVVENPSIHATQSSILAYVCKDFKYNYIVNSSLYKLGPPSQLNWIQPYQVEENGMITEDRVLIKVSDKNTSRNLLVYVTDNIILTQKDGAQEMVIGQNGIGSWNSAGFPTLESLVTMYKS